MTVGEAKSEGISLLQGGGETRNDAIVLTETPRLDCDCILSYITGIPKDFILSHPEMSLTNTQYQAFLSAIQLRCAGLPVAYIVSSKEFFGYDFYVTPHVLIPKPDTELLVEYAEVLLDELLQQIPGSIYGVDVCTGSGCIAISLVNELLKRVNADRVVMTACDISMEALAVAKKNCDRYNSAIHFVQGDLLQPFLDKGEQFDFVLSNPPYVPHNIAQELLLDGRSEPLLALDGDCDGTRDGTGLIRRLIPQIYAVLKKGGFSLIEVGEYNADIVACCFSAIGFSDVSVLNDLSGQPRVIQARKER